MDKYCTRILYQNIQGLQKKVNHFSALSNKNSYDVLCVSEHWLRSQDIEFINMEGFNVADAFFRNIYACGGVVIFLSILLTFKVINLKWFCEEKNFEAVAIIVKQLNIIVACVYRSPSGNVDIFLNKLEKLLLHLSKYGLVMLIGGDFNSDFDVNVPQPNVTRFLNLLNQFNCHCTNFNPTRNNACLDNIVINQDFKDFKVFVVEESLSDHSGVLMCMNNSQKMLAIEWNFP